MAGFIGVHVGAGNFSTKSEDAFLKVCRKACREGTSVLKEGGTALDAATATTCILEDSPITNAGIGSNLTWDGCVECDAMVMDGRTLHCGAVGAVAGVKNPAALARYLCHQQSVCKFPHGRLKPSIVVGEGARIMAVEAGLTTVPPTDLIVGRSLKLYKHYKKRLVKLESSAPQAAATFRVVAPLDTVGAVCVDADGNVAAACSSGGIALKAAGRLGQAATFGGGCWAENGPAASVATSTSGCGEYLIRTALGKEAARGVQTADFPTVRLDAVMKEKFLESPLLRGMPDKLAGVIVIRCDAGDAGGEFLWAQTTRDMCVGYMSTADQRPLSRMSRLANGMKAGESVVVEGIKFGWSAR